MIVFVWVWGWKKNDCSSWLFLFFFYALIFGKKKGKIKKNYSLENQFSIAMVANCAESSSYSWQVVKGWWIVDDYEKLQGSDRYAAIARALAWAHLTEKHRGWYSTIWSSFNIDIILSMSKTEPFGAWLSAWTALGVKASVTIAGIFKSKRPIHSMRNANTTVFLCYE